MARHIDGAPLVNGSFPLELWIITEMMAPKDGWIFLATSETEGVVSSGCRFPHPLLFILYTVASVFMSRCFTLKSGVLALKGSLAFFLIWLFFFGYQIKYV